MSSATATSLFEMASTDVESEDSFLLKESVIRGHHVFKDVRVGEILRIGKEAGNTHDRRAVAVLKGNGTIVGHALDAILIAHNLRSIFRCHRLFRTVVFLFNAPLLSACA